MQALLTNSGQAIARAALPDGLTLANSCHALISLCTNLELIFRTPHATGTAPHTLSFALLPHAHSALYAPHALPLAT